MINELIIIMPQKELARPRLETINLARYKISI